MTQFFQQIINGLSLGSIYALIALGYTMVYGILKLINFAHGEVFMVGAYTGFYAAGALGVAGFEARNQSFPLYLAVLVLIVAMAAAAVLGGRDRISGVSPGAQRPPAHAVDHRHRGQLVLAERGDAGVFSQPPAVPGDLE